MSGDDEVPLVRLPASLGPLITALRALTARDLPAVAVVGGVAVNVRLSTTTETHRATRDVDVVSDDAVPGAVEVLARYHPTRRSSTVIVDGIEIDVIVAQSVTNDDLDGLTDGQRLFVAGHRWALDTAEAVRLNAGGPGVVVVPVATPAGLVSAKSHAVGYPRSTRRATKHGGDLFDVYRLVEIFDRQGQLRDALTAAPFGLGGLVAEVIDREILSNPARAANQMASSSTSGPPRTEQVVDILEPFAAELRV